MKWILPAKHPGNLIDWLLAQRNIKDRENFLNPQLAALYSTKSLYGIEEAVKVITDAIKQKKKIYIHGDFDVDGITATSIMWNYLYKVLNANVLPFIPNRFTDGYGISEENIKKIIDEDGDLIISVDCGIKDIELVNKYADQIDFVITDHHTLRNSTDDAVEGSKVVGDFLISSKALAVVHPHLNKKYAFKEICGAVVSWKLCSGINDFLGGKIDMLKYLDLAALGTVCDVMPLIDENRIIVKFGLEQMKHTENKGLRELIKVADLKLNELDAYHFGFVIGPRLNAAGRLDTALEGVRLLTTESDQYANQLARKLNEMNKARQDLTKLYFEQAEKEIIKELSSKKIHFIYGEEWPEGIVGLIAGKLTEKYNKPVLIGSSTNNIIKASARSIPSFNIAEKLKLLDKYLLRHGGHIQAAGLSLGKENYDAFLRDLEVIAETEITDEELQKVVVIDAIASIRDVNIELAQDLLKLAPFGNGNKKPVFALLAIDLKPGVRYMGKDENHIKFFTGDLMASVECLGFGMREKFETIKGKKVDIIGNIDVDSWNGNSKVVFKVIDIRDSE